MASLSDTTQLGKLFHIFTILLVLRLALTITLTLTDTGFAVLTLLLGYRRHSPDPNASIQIESLVLIECPKQHTALSVDSCTMVSVLSGHLFVEASAYRSGSWWDRQDCPDRRERHGKGQVPSWTSASCQTALGFWYL